MRRRPGFPAVVTRFHLMTRPLPEMYQSLYIYPISEYKKVLKWVIDVGSGHESFSLSFSPFSPFYLS